jgi:phage terminase large subunit GpA-like protein
MIFATADEDLAGRASNRINSSIRVTPRLSALLSRPEDATRAGFKLKNGASLIVAWATSLAKLASDPAEYAFADEASKYPDYSGSAEKKESSPLDLIRQRQNSYTYTKKLMVLSSPGAAPCLISRLVRYEADEAYRFEVDCPVCGVPQVMSDEQIVALRNIHDPRQIKREKLGRYGCVSCGMYWDDYLRNRAVTNGRWVCGTFNSNGEWHRAAPLEHPVAGAFHLPSWYNLALSLSDVVAARFQGEDDVTKKMVYITQYKAEEYNETIDPKKASQVLDRRTKLPAGIVPASALALTCGIDSHNWGYRFSIYAWCEDDIGFTCHKILNGHIGTLADVKKLVFESRYLVEKSSESIGIFRAAIDTGGGKKNNESDKTATEEIYNWLRQINDEANAGILPNGRLYGIKGASQRTEARVKTSIIDKMPHSGKPIPGGLELHIIDTHQFKVMLHWRLTRQGKLNDSGIWEPEENQQIFFDADTTDAFARELLAEELRRKINGHIEWIKIRSANHDLDTTIYAMACADGEWQPSLKILAPRIKWFRGMQTIDDPARKPGHPARHSDRPRHEENSYRERPDISSIRERFSNMRDR